MSNAMEWEEKLLKYPLGINILLIIGFILRIIPIYINLIGYVLTLIGWFYLYKWGRNNYYVFAIIGSILLIAGEMYGLLMNITTLLPGETAISTETENMTFIDLKNYYLKTVDSMEREMSDPSKYLAYYVILGVALIIEGFVFIALSKDTRTIPLYIFILFITLGLLNITRGVLFLVLAPNLEDVKKAIYEANTIDELNTKPLFTLLGVLAPLIAIGLIIFVIGLITYILVAYKFNKLGSNIKKLVVMKGLEKPEKVEESKLI